MAPKPKIHVQGPRHPRGPVRTVRAVPRWSRDSAARKMLQETTTTGAKKCRKHDANGRTARVHGDVQCNAYHGKIGAHEHVRQPRAPGLHQARAGVQARECQMFRGVFSKRGILNSLVPGKVLVPKYRVTVFITACVHCK